MPEETPEFRVRTLEPEVRALWKNRRLPPPGGILGANDGPLVRQFEGAFTASDLPELVAHRAVVADVDARHCVLSGRGVVGTLRYEHLRADATPNRIGAILEALGVWTGGSSDRPWDDAERQAGIQAIVSRLARREILAARDGPLRLCLSCRRPRTPERIIYQKEVGDTFLVRFPLAGTDPPVDALVWVDAPWRLLGASALLVHPEVPYAVVEYRHKGSSALLLTSHGSLDRLRSWLPDVELEVKEERPGKEWVGKVYAYPLRHEFPIGGSLDPPAGSIQSDLEVGDTGTGIVPLVPGHGPTDAEIADRLGIAGWPLLTSRGVLDPTLMHKYAGLDVETANDFVARDLTESGSVLARLRVVRGVPYCAVCGHRMIWTPGRAWCLEPGRLPAEQKDRYARLLPSDRPIGQIEVARWPVSETSASTDPEAVSLLECSRCERLDAPDGPPVCPCGGTRRLVARRLLPSIAGAFGAWSRADPLPRSDTIRVYANERRRAPALVHHLTAMSGIDASGSEFGLTLVPTVNRIDLAQLIAAHGSDAVRSAFVRTAGSGGSTTSFEERCRQEEERLARFFDRTEALLERIPPEILREGAQPPDASSRDLEVEDRAILSRWARTHLRVLAAYNRWEPEHAHRHLFRFLERDLLAYLEITSARVEPTASTATRRGALRTRAYLLRAAAVALAPIAPFTAEAVHRRLLSEPRSLFETLDLGADRTLIDDELSSAWDRWQNVTAAADSFRRAQHLPPETVLPLAALVLSDEDVAARLRADRTTLERLVRIARLEVTSPKVPWAARQRRIVPVESEIQRAYPSLVTTIVHLLARMPPRPATDAPAKELTVVVHGVSRTISPQMVTLVDTLPEGYTPTPYGPGEMYVQSPGKGSAAPAPPPLSTDAFWLVRRVRRRLAGFAPVADAPGRVAIVTAIDPLAAELRDKAALISSYLGLRELRVVEGTSEALPHSHLEGRTRTGAHWSVALPGVPGHRRAPKHRPVRSTGRRVPDAADAASSSEIDYASEAVIAREESIRVLGRELDELVAAPLLGPAKLTIAWDAGLRSMQEYRDAPFDRVAGLAGFGRPVAATLWEKLGRAVPPAPPRPRRPEGNGHGTTPIADRPREMAPPPVSAPRALPPSVIAPPPPPLARSMPPRSTPARMLPPPPVVPSLPPGEPAAPPTPPAPPSSLEMTPGEEPGSVLPLPSTEETPDLPSPFAPSSEPAVTELDESAPPDVSIPSDSAQSLEPVLAAEPTGAPTDLGIGPEVSPDEAVAELMRTAVASDAAESSSLPADLAPVPESPGESSVPYLAASTSADTPDGSGAGGIDPNPMDSPGPSTETEDPRPPFTASVPDSIESGTTSTPEHVPETPSTGSEPAPPVREEPLTTRTVEPVAISPEGESAGATLAERTDASEPPLGVPPYRTDSEPLVVPPVTPTPEPGGEIAPSIERLGVDLPILERTNEPNPELRPEEGLSSPESQREETALPDLGPPGSELSVPVPLPETSPLPLEELPALAPAETPRSDAIVAPESSTALDSIAPEEAPTVEQEPVGSEGAPVQPLPAEIPPPGAVEPIRAPPEAVAVAPTASDAPTNEGAPALESAAPPAVESPSPPPSPIPSPTPELGSVRSALFSIPAPAPVVSAPPPPVVVPPPPPSGVEIDFSSALFMALQPFLDATAAGHKGIALVRELPERIRVHIGPRPVEVYWLTNLDRPRTVRPSDLGAMAQRFHRALEDDGVTAVFLEGVEYLVGIHGVERVGAFLREIDALARQHVARVWVHLTPSLMSEAGLDQLLATVRAPPPGEAGASPADPSTSRTDSS